jgi:murein DD-endopeptidase MepM/ murein hydrolase activator NlpD
MCKRSDGFDGFLSPAERAFSEYVNANPQSVLGGNRAVRAVPLPRPKPAAAIRAPASPQRKFETPTSGNIAHIIRNPHLRDEFEYLFGPMEQYLTPDQMTEMPKRYWDPQTMRRPFRGNVDYPPRGGDFTDDSGVRMPHDRYPTGSYKLPEPASDKALPLEFGYLPTKTPATASARIRQSAPPYDSGVYDPFGLYRTYPGGARKPHYGPDMPAQQGTPVRAAAGGRAYTYRNVGDLGDVIAIQHNDGTASLYGHLGGFNIKNGDVVMAGDQIGAVGVSGNANKGKTQRPQLHFEVFEPDPADATPVPRIGRNTLDPIEWLKRPHWYRGELLPKE